MKLTENLAILAGTYLLALAILTFGNMNRFVVALLPCLALGLGLIIRK